MIPQPQAATETAVETPAAPVAAIEIIAAPVAEPVAVAVAAPPAPAPAPIQAPAQQPSTASDELQQVLQAAGLTLAATDPEKLRAAQQAAAQIAPTPHIPRERKPATALPTEPLVQIETRHP
jgi:ribonuclease E